MIHRRIRSSPTMGWRGATSARLCLRLDCYAASRYELLLSPHACHPWPIVQRASSTRRSGSTIAQQLIGESLPVIKCEHCSWLVVRLVSTTLYRPNRYFTNVKWQVSIILYNWYLNSCKMITYFVLTNLIAERIPFLVLGRRTIYWSIDTESFFNVQIIHCTESFYYKTYIVAHIVP